MRGWPKTKEWAMVAAIDSLTGDDPEADHGAVEEMLLDHAGPEIRAAVDRLVDRAGWWA